MTINSRIHNSAWFITENVLGVLDSRIIESEYRLLFMQLYRLIREGLVEYEERAERWACRLNRDSNGGQVSQRPEVLVAGNQRRG